MSPAATPKGTATAVSPPVDVARILAEYEPLVPVTLTSIRTTDDISVVLVEIQDATKGIRSQMLADVRRYEHVAELADEGDGTLAQTSHANLAAAVVTLASCVEALARVNA